MHCPRAYPLTRLLLCLAAIVAVTVPARAGQHAAKALTADHAAVQALKTALESGEAFKMSFVALPPAPTDAVRRRQERAVGRAMRRLRATLPEKPSYAFLHGAEFALGATDERTVAVKQPVGGEKQPSLFRLASKPVRQVYVVFGVAGAKDRSWRVHALMQPVKDGWKTGGLTAFLDRIGTLNAEAALAAGQKEAAAGHDAVALALFGLANELGKTPRYRTSALHDRVGAAYAPLAKKIGLPGKPVATVATGGGRFAISYTNARIFGKGAYLLLFREAAQKDRPKDTAAHQKQLAAAFLKAHPEAKAYFVGIAVNERYTDANGIESDDRGLFGNEELAE